MRKRTLLSFGWSAQEVGDWRDTEKQTHLWAKIAILSEHSGTEARELVLGQYVLGRELRWTDSGCGPMVVFLKKLMSSLVPQKEDSSWSAEKLSTFKWK
jgi:hypothetical protein